MSWEEADNLRESPGWGKKDVIQVNGNWDLGPAVWREGLNKESMGPVSISSAPAGWWGGGKCSLKQHWCLTALSHEKSCPSRNFLEIRHFCPSPYVPVALQLLASVYEWVTPGSPTAMDRQNPWYSQPDIVGTSLPGTDSPSLGALCEDGTPHSSGGSSTVEIPFLFHNWHSMGVLPAFLLIYMWLLLYILLF